MFETAIGISEQEPYFMHSGHKVYELYDPPHLVKNDSKQPGEIRL